MVELFTGYCTLCIFQDKQRSPYALNTAGDAADDQDGDSRYSTTNE